MDRWNPIHHGGRDVLVVPRSALLPNDPASVACLIEDALGHPEGRAAFAKWLGVTDDQLEDPEVRARAMRSLTQGHWRAIEVGRADPPRGSVFDVPVPEPTGPALPRKKNKVVEQTWIEIERVGIAGGSFAGAVVTLRLPTSEVVEMRLDADSRLRIDTIVSPGACKLELRHDARRAGLIPLARRPEIRGQEPRIIRGGPAIALATGARHIVVVEGNHAFSC